MNTVSTKAGLHKVLPIAILLCLIIGCLLVWMRALSQPAIAEPPDIDIRELSESRAQQLSQLYGRLCIEIAHFTPDGLLVASDLDSSDQLPPKAHELASEYGISEARVGDTFVDPKRLLIASTTDPRAVPHRDTAIVFEAVELQRYTGGAKGIARWEVVHTEEVYPCDQQGNPIPITE